MTLFLQEGGAMTAEEENRKLVDLNQGLVSNRAFSDEEVYRQSSTVLGLSQDSIARRSARPTW